jgi:hypothetical protein
MTTQTRSSSPAVVGREMWRPSLATAVATRPTRRKLVVALAVAVVALLAAGIPLTTSVLFAGLAACLGMHLFMGHGNGDHHAAEHSPESTVDR